MNNYLRDDLDEARTDAEDATLAYQSVLADLKTAIQGLVAIAGLESDVARLVAEHAEKTLAALESGEAMDWIEKMSTPRRTR